jgi:protein phosphatase
MLTRSIGNDLIVAVETSEHLVFAGDILMLCSDGLHGAIAEDELAAIVSGHKDLKDAAEALIALANERDGSDNVSVQLIRVLAVERVGIYRGRSYKL